VNASPEPAPGPSLFERRLTILTLSLLLVALSFHLLRELAAVLQPLFIAALLTYMAVPMHQWLVRKGVPSRLGHVVLLGLVLFFFFLVGRLAQSNFEQLRDDWPVYKKKIDQLIANLANSLPFPIPELQGKGVDDLVHAPTVEQLLKPMQVVFGGFANFMANLFIVILYLVFLAAEVFTFRRRAEDAFGPARAEQVMTVIQSINLAVGGYLAVMTLINALIGLLTIVVLALFQIPFAPLWGLLMFLFCYIPYIGSVLVTIAIVLLSFVEWSAQPWVVLILGVILIGIQQFLGSYLQPKLMGNRLGVSPLLILLSLGFWGLVWGIVGMLLAVPLLMVLKITLENIPETRPIAKLMSNA
jgi:AI-2 transport protein TqsA